MFMKTKFKQVANHPLISGSIVIFAGTIFANFSNFLFNLFMSRTLSIVDYGVLAALNSLILVFALIAESFVPTIVHFAGTFMARAEEEKVRGIFLQANKIAIVLGGAVFLFFLFFSGLISRFFNINNNFLLAIVGVIIFFGFLGSLNRAILQAKLLFKYISFVNAFSSLIKLTVGILLVFLGFKVEGAVFGFLISFFATYVLVFIPLRYFFKKNKNYVSVSFNKILSYGAPTALALFGLTFFITTDILLVKHFFPSREAGIYAGLSLVGRVIYFFSAPLVGVMFPIIVQKHTRLENYHNTFRLSLILAAIPSIILTILYFTFPQFIIRIFLKNTEYLEASSLLGYFGIFMSLYIMLYVFTNFYLSIKKTKVYIPILMSSILQAVLIWFFHRTFLEIIVISLISTSLPFTLLVVYYLKYAKSFK